MYWDCPRCAAENSLDSKSCWRCGYQYFAGTKEPASSGEWSRRLSDLAQKERESIRDEIRKSLEASAERSKPSLERLAGPPPASAAPQDGPGPPPREKPAKPKIP